jgi:rod shape-determining protein MreD
MNPTNGGWLILLTILLGMVLAVLHLPESLPQWLGWLRPSWVALVVFFWVLEVPHRIGLVSAWILGLGLDVLQAEPLGLNGALLAGLTYVTWRFYERVRMYSTLQQCGLLFVLLTVMELLRAGARDLLGSGAWSAAAFLPPLISAVIWPLLFGLLQQLRIQARVE